MICPKCMRKNIKKANYCIDCGYEFSEEEREKAYKKTIYYFIEKLEDLKDKITLDFITDTLVFKIISLLLVLGIGLYFLFTKGINTTIVNDKSYELYYYEKEKYYYILVDDDINKVNISLYIPNRAKTIKIKHYNSNNTLIDTKKYNKKKGLKLSPYNNDYYVINTTYTNKKEDNLKLIIYHKSDIKK